MRTSRMITGSLALALLCASPVAAEENAESTVTLNGGSTALGIGTNWGEGTLEFEGYQYPFSMRGLTVGDVGITAFSGSGVVHNLTRPEDFNGNYTALLAGLTIAGGGSAITMRNQHGVTMNVLLTTRGLKVLLAGGGINFEIPESGFADVRAQKAAEAAAARADDAVHRAEAAADRIDDAMARVERVTEEATSDATSGVGRRARSQGVAGTR
jgi:hypothetical protein